MQRKNCFKLKEKLQDTPDLVVGLKYVREVIACSSEEEPYYYCELCPSKGQANMMFNHVLGKEHRKQVLKKLKPHIVNDNARVILEELKEFRETDWSVIDTIYSDEQYPWESGKAPWSVERGGTGEIPTAVRNKDICYAGGRGGGTARESRNSHNVDSKVASS